MVTFAGVRLANGSIVPLTGEPVIHKFDFSHSTAGLNNGVTVYVPTIGDILLDAWVEIDTAFDGTTPHLDLSQFVNGTLGWFKEGCGKAMDITAADGFEIDSGGLLSSSGQIQFEATAAPPPVAPGPISLTQIANTFTASNGTNFTHIGLTRAVPAKFTTSAPVKLVVSQDGAKGGTAAGSTVGSGTLFLYVGTPV